MKPVNVLASLALAAMFASCGSSQKALYSWGNYETASYAYTKEPTEQNERNLITTYRQLIEQPKGARKVAPPGMCAELGYMYYKKGDKANATKYLQMEIELYPESAVFIKRILDAI